VRPLPATSADRTASITRRHFLIDHAPEQRGLYSVVGGKLTTHRSLAESALDTILKELGKSAPCPTRDLMLPGSGEIDPQTLAGSMAGVALEPAIARRLVSIYGSKSGEVLASAQESPEFLKALTPSSPVLGAEVVYGFEQEMATNLADLLLRRIMAAYDRGMGLDVAKAAVAVAKRHLGWTDARVETELARYREALTRFRPLVLR
jgi:glycerol-3-phosphate dehydrogenase